jgi:hypothetical protein
MRSGAKSPPPMSRGMATSKYTIAPPSAATGIFYARGGAAGLKPCKKLGGGGGCIRGNCSTGPPAGHAGHSAMPRSWRRGYRRSTRPVSPPRRGVPAGLRWTRRPRHRRRAVRGRARREPRTTLCLRPPRWIAPVAPPPRREGGYREATSRRRRRAPFRPNKRCRQRLPSSRARRP